MATRPPWDGRVYDASLLNTRQPAWKIRVWAKSLAADFDAAAEGRAAPEAPAKADEAPAPKGQGRGKVGKSRPPPPPPSAAAGASSRAKRSSPARPYGRWLDWRALGGERLKDTVFDVLRSVGSSPPVNAALLELHFGHKAELAKCAPAVPEASQNMLIAFRRQPLTTEFLKAVEDIDFATLSTETVEVLLSAMPTEEEAKQLLGYRGDPAQLRRLEQDDMSASYHGERSWLQGRAEELHRGFQVWRRGTTAVLKSRALSETLRHLLSLGNTLNGGKVEGFSLEVLPRLGLSKATGDQRITLLHVLVMQLSSQHSQLPQTLLEELQELRSLASMPLPNLALDLAAFGDDVQLARQLLRQAFPAFDPPPERFFIGDDVEAVADAELSNSIIAKHLLRDVYMRIAQAPPEPLKQMVQTASAELQQLKAELAELREQVATMLAFFAYGEIAA
eukprot:g15396.t1